MSLLHGLAAFAEGGVTGLQAIQRDWSPFLVHFTSASAMAPVRKLIKRHTSSAQIRRALGKADSDSFKVAEKVGRSMSLRSHGPAEKDGVPACVSLSECTLPGLLGLCERYGRFGFVFEKETVFAMGGRPCVYVDRDVYGFIAARGRAADADANAARLFGIANVYSPTGAVGRRVQDYTHEREWRLFANIDLKKTPPEFFICPKSYIDEMKSLFGNDALYLPIDTMFAWGA